MMSNSIQKMYLKVPRTYEFINHLLTLRQDILWRKRAAKIASSAGGLRWLDACTGTGEMAFNLSASAGKKTSIIATDFSLPMMHQAHSKSESENISFILADSSHLPFQDNFFDAITMSFATRNINTPSSQLSVCLKEFHRILKPGGIFVNLETSQPQNRPIRWIYHHYVKLMVEPIGRLVSGSDTAYRYLSTTIRRFYSAEELAEIIRQAGFEEVSFQRMMLGAVAIHKAIK